MLTITMAEFHSPRERRDICQNVPLYLYSPANQPAPAALATIRSNATKVRATGAAHAQVRAGSQEIFPLPAFRQ